MALLRGFSKYYFERLMVLPYNRLFSEQTSVYQQGENTIISVKKESKPKRPPNQYSIYVKEVFEKFKTQGEKSTTNLQKIAAEWKALSEEQKKPYAEKAERLKKEYEQQQLTVQNVVETVKSAADTKQVRRPTGYQIFLKEKTQALKQQFPDKSAQEIKKEVSAHWKGLTEAEKQQFKLKTLQNLPDIADQEQTYKNILQNVPLSIKANQPKEKPNLKNGKKLKISRKKVEASTEKKDFTKQNPQSTEDTKMYNGKDNLKKIQATTEQKEVATKQNPQTAEDKNMEGSQNSKKDQGQKISKGPIAIKNEPSNLKGEESRDVSLKKNETQETQSNVVATNLKVVGGEKEQVVQEKIQTQQSLTKKQEEEEATLELKIKEALVRQNEKNGKKTP